MELKYKMTKVEKPVLEPLFERYSSTWQAHHVTNPTVVRLTGDERVFLGYRAGGDRDHYIIDDNDVFSSSLGLAVFDATADSLLCRFPLPIMKITRTVPLPQTPEEYREYIKENENIIQTMHDFRLYEHGGHLYCVYHDGAIIMAYDCVKRMAVGKFLEKVEKSIELAKIPVPEMEREWHRLWDYESEWESCGFGENRRMLFPQIEGRPETKTDVSFFDYGDRMQLMRRPVPDIAVFDTEGVLGKTAADGNQEFGVLEICTRYGLFDNSHIGPNGMPTLADIYGKKVYIDISHGVHNAALARDGDFAWEMHYAPFLMIKDAANGELLYYSEQPLVDIDDPVWEEYTRNGRWIKQTPHKFILFTGGQTEREKGKIGADDRFICYSGAGDTAIVRADFTLSRITPPEVLADIARRDAHRALAVRIPENRASFPERLLGWEWSVYNDEKTRSVCVSREFAFKAGPERAVRPFYTRPGYFDADMMVFDGKSLRFFEDYGWCLLYAGARWAGGETRVSAGLLVLDKENPEKVLYRSALPAGEIAVLEGYRGPEDFINGLDQTIFDRLEEIIPEQVRFEIQRGERLIKEGSHWRSHHSVWLENRTGKWLEK